MPKDNIKPRIKSLKDEELRLFHSYNRHATSGSKLAILTQLINTINRIDELEKL